MSEKKLQIINFQKGDVIFRQGDEEKILYKILLGKVGIYSGHGGEHEMRLSLLHKDQCFGEMSILENCPRSATAVAEEALSLMLYPAELMSLFVRQNPNFALELMLNLSGRLRNSTGELEKMYRMLLDVSEKKAVGADIQEYIHLHTTYSPTGIPMFNLYV